MWFDMMWLDMMWLDMMWLDMMWLDKYELYMDVKTKRITKIM
jgi:hypothetical protein